MNFMDRVVSSIQKNFKLRKEEEKPTPANNPCKLFFSTHSTQLMTIWGWGFCSLPVSSAWLWLCTCRMTRTYLRWVQLSWPRRAIVNLLVDVQFAMICQEMVGFGEARSQRDLLWMALFALFISISIQTNSRPNVQRITSFNGDTRIYKYTLNSLFKVFLCSVFT